MKTKWYVLDMDQGVLRKEPTRKAALKWWMDLQGTGKVLRRHPFGPGAYEYVTGFEGGGEDDTCGGIFIECEDAALRGGWSLDVEPLYPYPGERRFEEAKRS